jgi:hypothetical protein
MDVMVMIALFVLFMGLLGIIVGPRLYNSHINRTFQLKNEQSHRQSKIHLQQIADPKIRGLLDNWIDFYGHVLGIGLDISEIEIPKTNEYFSRLIIISKRVSAQSIWDVSGRYFGCKPFVRYNGSQPNLDEWFCLGEYRPSGRDYAMWVIDNEEPESPAMPEAALLLMRAQGASYITLKEHLIFRLKYFHETGRQLDALFPTSCLGSECDVGNMYAGSIPVVHYRNSQAAITEKFPNGYFRRVSL